jgi:hypothetical protein
LSNFRNNSSAGGQLEQPSDVNSSTKTGTRPAAAAALGVDCGRVRAAIAKIDKPTNIKEAIFNFITVPRAVLMIRPGPRALPFWKALRMSQPANFHRLPKAIRLPIRRIDATARLCYGPLRFL